MIFKSTFLFNTDVSDKVQVNKHFGLYFITHDDVVVFHQEPPSDGWTLSAIERHEQCIRVQFRESGGGYAYLGGVPIGRSVWPYRRIA